MRFFSNRKRPMHLGPHPFERLLRQNAIKPVDWQEPQPATTPTDSQGSIASRYRRVFLDADTIPVAETKTPLPSDVELTHEIKSTCYFLDAAATGICHLENGPDRCQRAIVILVESGRPSDPGNPASEWTDDDSTTNFVEMRVTEISVVLAGYIRQLGHDAHVHVGRHDDQQLMTLAVAAGIGTNTSVGLDVPFVNNSFALGAVLTSLPLKPDQPLRTNGTYLTWRARLAHVFGLGGVRSALHENKLRRRGSHLGSYPMERIKHQDTPTTLIVDDDVPRVPKRANFFARAGHGDLGPKTQRERDRFATKHPLAYAMRPLMGALVPHRDGPVATSKLTSTKNPKTNANAIKSLAYTLGADIVGIGPAVPYAWYSHDADGEPLPIRHKTAIVILIDQGFDTSEGSSGDDWISGSQSMRAYLRGAEIAGVLAAHIRSVGYAARSHTNSQSDVLHLPLLLHAGLGELSRIGELVLNPFLGPRSKSVVVTTDMPLEFDRPIDFGLQDFCSQCRKCARECPCNAISYKNKVMFNGYEMWKPDVERCTRYRVTNPKGSSCGRCMKVCPFANEGLISHRLFLWFAVHVPFTRRFIIRLDDTIKHGARNPIKRWWRDLNRTPEGSIDTAPATNERDLKLKSTSKIGSTQQIAYYPAEVMPPAAASEAHPVDRAKALEAAAHLETPAQARERLNS